MREPPDRSTNVLSLLAGSAAVIILLGGFVGVIKRAPIATEALTNQQLFVEGYLKEQRHAPAAITPKPEQRELARGESKFIEKQSSRRSE